MRVEDAQGNFTPPTVYRTVTAMDARGNVNDDTLDNGIDCSHSCDGKTVRVQPIQSRLDTSTGRQNQAYTWDVLGNLKQRAWTRDGTTRSET